MGTKNYPHVYAVNTPITIDSVPGTITTLLPYKRNQGGAQYVIDFGDHYRIEVEGDIVEKK